MIDMRIAMGGLLINESSLLRPLKHPLDACITNWNWLHQNTSWIMDKVAQNPNLQCPDKIMPGSFFSGTGMAVFRCSDIHNDTDPQSWSLSFSVLIRPRKHSGQVMALLTGDHDPLVKLHFTQQDRHENFKLILGATTLIDIRGPSRLCNGQILNITITESEATLQIGDQSGHQSVDATAFAALKTSWFKKDTLLFLGSLPALDKLGDGWFYYWGCMQDIRIQGTQIDFNQAYFKDDGVSAHNCPAPKQRDKKIGK
ncbi:vitamin K-dependent protein S-like [Mustelus asterias]